MRRILLSVAVLVAALAVPLLPGPAAAAGLTAVPDFGSNPGNLAMYEYVPASVRAAPAVVVAMHGCTQTAADYHGRSGWPKYADAYGFVVVFPEQRTGNNANRCFNWFQPGDATRGQGEALSVRQMVDSARSRHPGGAAYVTGLSGGGAMTAVLLAAYPEVFAGGSVVAGLPAGCASDVVSAFSCMNPGVDRTPAQWRAAVQPAAAYPRVAVWHGTADTTVVPRNADELRDQWTAVHGVAATPTSTGTLPGTTVETYGSGQVRVYRVAGMGHGTPVDPGGATEQCGTAGAYFLDTVCSSYYTARFWGLDAGGPGPAPTATTAPPPVPATCHPGTNYEHVQAGRATTTGGYVYARGSGQAMGLHNVFIRHTLRQSPPGYYTVADAGCP
ncbi:MAG: Poly(3-hydroxyalkanoate) depolymerase [uncultured Corynebacteriales bacterium]|uniref:Poly(3-hydroxyalkanoate) depolymerase n=1 Tax=uncultured Mycobacteriales bacterium TaxID=581187 RepID=A0A6J4HD53_9ACTN|nr:MAG: Poly(3-hydroxyalkanoate) depolymerase [uncultured Corynebacteriales bacterium]